MMKEYWQDPDRTAGTIKKGFLYTGDLTRMDEDGYFFIVDPAKDIYIRGGENIYPSEVEQVLKELPEIEDIAIVGIPDETLEKVGHAFVIRKPEANLDDEDIINLYKTR
jgi:acyl-CoA synthetase (AMP-forming)/AMP-acid ligase II